MAARGTGRKVPICHDEQEKVMNALEAAKYEVCVCLCAYMLGVLLPSHAYFCF